MIGAEGSTPETQILVVGGSKPGDGGEAEKSFGEYRVRTETKIPLTVLSREIVKVTMVDNMHPRRIDPCTCSKSGNGSATGKQACSWHPGGIERWQEDQRRRTNAELARRLKIRRETERRQKEESIRSKNIRCCTTSLLGEAL